ncbi:MAG: hypothetical protein MMC23_007053 [Stictis urceolatum]|nr:hypothetical protein [Stictis urceolata]
MEIQGTITQAIIRGITDLSLDVQQSQTHDTTCTQTGEDDRPFPFMDLPPELRNIVYQYAMIDPDKQHVRIIDRARDIHRRYGNPRDVLPAKPPTALLRTSKVVNHEARRYLYEHINFVFVDCVEAKLESFRRDENNYWENRAWSLSPDDAHPTILERFYSKLTDPFREWQSHYRFRDLQRKSLVKAEEVVNSLGNSYISCLRQIEIRLSGQLSCYPGPPGSAAQGVWMMSDAFVLSMNSSAISLDSDRLDWIPQLKINLSGLPHIGARRILHRTFGFDSAGISPLSQCYRQVVKLKGAVRLSIVLRDHKTESDDSYLISFARDTEKSFDRAIQEKVGGPSLLPRHMCLNGPLHIWFSCAETLCSDPEDSWDTKIDQWRCTKHSEKGIFERTMERWMGNSVEH